MFWSLHTWQLLVINHRPFGSTDLFHKCVCRMCLKGLWLCLKYSTWNKPIPSSMFQLHRNLATPCCYKREAYFTKFRLLSDTKNSWYLSSVLWSQSMEDFWIKTVCVILKLSDRIFLANSYSVLYGMPSTINIWCVLVLIAN